MRTLMDTPVWVHYGQLYVESGDGQPDFELSFRGQRNGLCGAAIPGCLVLITAIHTGDVRFTVELHDEVPPLDAGWDDVVEVSYRPAGDVALVGWAGTWVVDLELSHVEYRVRYSATGMDEGGDAPPPDDGATAPDRYLLQFWPETARPDEVVKVTSRQAAYWHDNARSIPNEEAPPSP